MEIFLQAVALVSELPGSLVYHLVLLFALGFSAAIALSQWWRERLMATARLTLAATAIFSLHFLIFGLTLAAALNYFNPLLVLPPFDRAVATLTVLLIIWAFTFPDPLLLVDLAFGGLGLLTLAGLGAGWFFWSGQVAAGVEFFNGSPQETVWEFAQMLLIISGLAIFSIRRKAEWPIGLALLLLLLSGHITHYFFTVQSDVAGAERLVELIAVPIFAAMVYRRVRSTLALDVISTDALPEPPLGDTWPRMAMRPTDGSLAERLSERPETTPPPTASPAPEPERSPTWNIDPKAAVALASLHASTNPADVAQIITVALAHTFNADLCLLLTPPDSSGASALAGSYDLITEKFRSGASLLLAEVPSVERVILQRESARLTVETHEPELRRLAAAVNLKQNGPALLVPLLPEDGPALGVIILLSPYAKRNWTEDDQNLLEAMVEPLAVTLATAERIQRLNAEIAAQQARLAEAQAHLKSEEEAHNQTLGSLATARSESLHLSQELADAQKTVEDITSQIRLQSPPPPKLADTGGFSAMRAELRVPSPEEDADRAQLEARLAEAEDKIAELTAQLEQTQTPLAERPTRPLVVTEPTETALLTLELERAREELSNLQAGLAMADLQLAASQQRETDLTGELRQLRDIATPDGAASFAETAQLQTELEQINHQLVASQQREFEFSIEVEHFRSELELAQSAQTRAQDQTQAAQQQVAELTTATEQARAELAQLQATLSSLVPVAELSEAHGQAAALRVELDNLRADAERTRFLDEQPTTRLAPVTDWQADLDQARQQLAETGNRETALRAEVERLQMEAAQFEAERQNLVSTADYLQVQSAAEQVRRELAQAQQRTIDLSAELDIARATHTHFAAEQQAVTLDTTSRLQAELTTLQHQLAEVTDREAALHDQLDRYRYETAHLEAERKTLVAAEDLTRTATERDQARAEHAQTQLTLTEAQQQAAGLAATLEGVRAQLAQHQADQQTARAQIAQLSTELETTHIQLAQRTESEAGRVAELEQIHGELIRLQNERPALVPAEELQQTQAALKETQQRVTDLGAHLAQSQDEVAALQIAQLNLVNLETFARVQTELGHQQQHVASLTAELDQARASLAQLQAEQLKLVSAEVYAAVRAEVAELKEQLTALRTEQFKLIPAETHARVVADLSDLQEQLTGLRASEEKLRSEVDRQRAERAQLVHVDDHTRVQTDLTRAQQRLEMQQQREAGLLAEVDRVNQALMQTQAERANFVPMDEYVRVQAELNAELDRTRAEIAQLKAQPSAASEQDQVKKLKTELRAAQRQINEASETEAVLTAELQRMRSGVVKLKTGPLTGTQTGYDSASLQKALDAALRQFSESREREIRLAAELDRLRYQLIESQQSPDFAGSADSAQVEAELEQAQAAFNESRGRETALRAELDHLRAELSDFRSDDHTRLQAELDQTRQQLVATQQRETALAAQLKSRLAAGLSATPDIEALRQQLTEGREREIALAAELDRLRAKVYHYETGPLTGGEDLIRLQEQLAETKKREEQALAAQAKLTTQMEQARTDYARLAAQLNAVKSATSAPADELVASLRSQLDLARRQAEGRNQLLVELAELKEKLRLTSQGVANEEYAYVRAQAEQLNKELELTRAELKKFTDQQASPDARAADPTGHAEVERLNQSLATLREQLSKKDRQLVKVQAALVALQGQATGATLGTKELVAEKEQQLTEAHTVMDNLKARAAELDRQLVQAQQTLATRPDPVALERLENQLAEMERRLVEAQVTAQAGGGSAASYEVIASLTQDIRQPLSSIVGYSELLLGESVGILGALQKKFLERIKASTERMGALLDDLIRVTAIDSGPLKLSREKLDVMNVVEEAIFSCGAQFREKGINLRLDFADDLPPVQADRDALRQIMTHLLNNAGSASAIDGEVKLSVKREQEQKSGAPAGDYLFIAVRDSGGGIRPEDQPKVFSRIYRADAPLIAGLGDTGVGLSVAKALVEAHGGRIWLTSEVGAGSTINLLLPVENVSTGVSAPPPPNGKK